MVQPCKPTKSIINWEKGSESYKLSQGCHMANGTANNHGFPLWVTEGLAFYNWSRFLVILMSMFLFSGTSCFLCFFTSQNETWILHQQLFTVVSPNRWSNQSESDHWWRKFHVATPPERVRIRQSLMAESMMCPALRANHLCHGHPILNRNPYNGYINPYYWVDDHPLLYGNNGSLDPIAHLLDALPETNRSHSCSWKQVFACILEVRTWKDFSSSHHFGVSDREHDKIHPPRSREVIRELSTNSNSFTSHELYDTKG